MLEIFLWWAKLFLTHGEKENFEIFEFLLIFSF